MRYRFKKIYSWLLILIMAISAVQSATAIDFSQNRQSEECQMMQMSLPNANGMKAGGNCPMEQGENKCIDAECITTPGEFSSPHAPHATLFAQVHQSQQKIMSGCDPILSHYPDLLKRPPRA